MFSHYQIYHVGDEDVLYLYMTYQYEFSKEFSTYQEQDLRVLSQKFIQTNHIPFKGHKVYFVVDGFIVKKIDIDHNKFYYSPDSFMISLELKDHSLCEISLKEYLLSILFSYYSTELGDEVLRCICILFNTYAYYCMAGEGKIQANNMFAYYYPMSHYQKAYSDYDSIRNRLLAIIQQTECLFLSYHNEYILPFIHSLNGGKTFSNIKYPYLSSVKSLWDMASPMYLRVLDFDYSALSKLLQVKIDTLSHVKVLDQGSSIKIGYKAFTVRELKELLNLPSDDITIIVNKNSLRFITRGSGNGLGLSLYGASCIEENGGTYQDILRYYFPKCVLCKNIKELS